MNASAEGHKQGRTLFEIAVLAFLAFAVFDVFTLFVTGALGLEGPMRAALSAFVYMQMAMTGASLVSIPVTLLLRIVKGATSHSKAA